MDNNSQDGTRTAFLNSINTIPKIYISTPQGIRGKGNNFLNLFKTAAHLNAKVIVVIDADLKSINPEWIKNLVLPIINEKYDYLTPLYSRNEYDGTITNHICYPLIYGLLGYDIRQPIGGDFALSGKLGQFFLKQSWIETTRHYGVDIFMTLHAILGNYKIGQVGLGAKIHKPSMPKLGPMFTQVVETLFKTLLNHKKLWQRNLSISNLPLLGNHQSSLPQNLSIDYKSIKAKAYQEFLKYKDTLHSYLDSETFTQIERMFNTTKPRLNMNLWCKVLYDLLHTYDQSNQDGEVIEALKCLYFGRVASFIRQTLDMDHIQSEQQIIKQSKFFYKKRNYLLQKY